MREIYSIFITILCLSCQPDSKELSDGSSDEQHYQEVTIKRFGFNDRLDGIDTTFLKKIDSTDSKCYIYNVYDHPDSLVSYESFKILKKSDSLYYYNEPCTLIKSKTYSIDQKLYEVSTYYYDIENSADEETTIYFTEEYGVLILFNDGWMVMAGIFEYDNISLKLTEAILSDSTNSFPLWGKSKTQLQILEVPYEDTSTKNS